MVKKALICMKRRLSLAISVLASPNVFKKSLLKNRLGVLEFHKGTKAISLGLFIRVGMLKQCFFAFTKIRLEYLSGVGFFQWFSFYSSLLREWLEQRDFERWMSCFFFFFSPVFLFLFFFVFFGAFLASTRRICLGAFYWEKNCCFPICLHGKRSKVKILMRPTLIVKMIWKIFWRGLFLSVLHEKINEIVKLPWLPNSILKAF